MGVGREVVFVVVGVVVDELCGLVVVAHDGGGVADVVPDGVIEGVVLE